MPPLDASSAPADAVSRPAALAYIPISAEEAAAIRAGRPDAYGAAPERVIAEGGPAPCRCCLRNIEPGEPMLILAHRPFPALDPYAETGPIFLHAEPCAPHDPTVPATGICRVNKMLVKGYLANDRIHYGTGRIVHPDDLPEAAAELLSDPRTAYLHVRSATNNCYQFRIERA
ncbi:DUF1203 domain-containing protein [Albimonas sp. CAU 1670]|uniref:DUF1203 domain-containing protein n=1 Tax=Albimonas sp. CAU 1670 TaxID=3032599 RepID=UPI0023DB4A61|nr:DUF1203 domain-containing protein [Albimonas sp. CAU 1670]MDF2235553.1 DUF1203 domain-containing protein [Albimonas sp. CAU 1670]